MDKRILEQYIDACENIKEIEKEIIRLKKRKRIVQDSVREQSGVSLPASEFSH